MIAEQIHAIWSRELKLAEFSDTDDFFDLGGHSLIMTQIQVAILTELGIEIPMDQLFRKSTVQQISEHIEAARSAA
ncbi:phosphopantetheine-binding protein (plasmid) [Streptomyces sp. PCS3-D2]|uniref:phosphopantetheine-binding protein n=1 Tax=Streptomyces sp. PCS3-D2 TaxID=1460244 RepID=UPI00044628CC|nr:phosphopantetheine-binding protein [Streptomyces sp. PCS3-D2]WKV76536.1 phosphopantetheine-binding protein [Streptomyces sp. PCS3-D2]